MSRYSWWKTIPVYTDAWKWFAFLIPDLNTRSLYSVYSCDVSDCNDIEVDRINKKVIINNGITAVYIIQAIIKRVRIMEVKAVMTSSPDY